jgi:hypothetical protein
MTNKINSHDVKVLATGVAVGGTVATIVLTNLYGRAFRWLNQKETLKSQFITWMFTTGIHLPEDQLYKEAQTQWDFIKQVTDN